jgi:hypothetical protein
MRDLQNAVPIFHLRNVGVPYNVGGACPPPSLPPFSSRFFPLQSNGDALLLCKIYIMPGLASVPCHGFVVASFWKMYITGVPQRERPPTRILLLSLASLFYVALNVFPAAILFTDVSCPCETEDCMGETSACKISRFTIFILMIIFYSLLAQMVQLALKINDKLYRYRLVVHYATYGDQINGCRNNVCCIVLIKNTI